MTLAEVERFLKGAEYRMKLRAQFDYSLANLIGVSVSRLFDNSGSFPAIADVYPNLFEDEKPTEADDVEIATTNSINNFLAFAMKHNAKMKGVETENYDD